METFKCIFGNHKYKILKEIPLYNLRNEEIGINFVTICENCGKIKNNYCYSKINNVSEIY